ncbi:MAG TPA: DUF1698 domain-containing protein [Acidimicrobiales bacterium]|nr:DUF1698 domain-containing protein [Acidimicrobiales bacterium]
MVARRVRTAARSGREAREDLPDAEDLAGLRAAVESVHWYHSIDLGNGIVTPGDSKTTPYGAPVLPEMHGRTVLDIGAFDGYYSFAAERAGASRVVALDHYMWGVDIDRRNGYWYRCNERDVIPDRRRDDADFWDPSLPRRRPFDLAHHALRSRVEPVVMDFMAGRLDRLGAFDVVLFLGVLYHLTDPIGALERLRMVTRGVAVIETEALTVAGHESDLLVRFIAGDELNGDHTNWNQVTEPALHALCRVAGFGRVETVVGPPESGGEDGYRIVVHAFV